MVVYASVASSKSLELDSHADTSIVGDDCLVIHDHNRPINVYIYDPKDDHRSAKTVNAAVGYQEPQSRQKFSLMVNQANPIDGLDNHLLCNIQCFLNGMHIREVPKFLAESPSVITHAKKLTDPFDALQLLIIPLQFSSVTSYFDVYSLSIAECENEDVQGS